MDLGEEGWFLWLWWYGGQGVKEERRGEEKGLVVRRKDQEGWYRFVPYIRSGALTRSQHCREFVSGPIAHSILTPLSQPPGDLDYR